MGLTLLGNSDARAVWHHKRNVSWINGLKSTSCVRALFKSGQEGVDHQLDHPLYAADAGRRQGRRPDPRHAAFAAAAAVGLVRGLTDNPAVEASTAQGLRGTGFVVVLGALLAAALLSESGL